MWRPSHKFTGCLWVAVISDGSASWVIIIWCKCSLFWDHGLATRGTKSNKATVCSHVLLCRVSDNLLVMITVVSYRLKNLRLGLSSEDQWSAYSSFSLLEQNQTLIGMTHLELDSGKYPYVLGEPYCHVMSSCKLAFVLYDLKGSTLGVVLVILGAWFSCTWLIVSFVVNPTGSLHLGSTRRSAFIIARSVHVHSAEGKYQRHAAVYVLLHY